MTPSNIASKAMATFGFLLILFLGCSPNLVLARVHSGSSLQILSPIGGSSSPFQARTPAWNLQKTPGQQSVRRNQPAKIEEDHDADSDVATREMINSFLTRESRNSFIGTKNRKILIVLLRNIPSYLRPTHLTLMLDTLLFLNLPICCYSESLRDSVNTVNNHRLNLRSIWTQSFSCPSLLAQP